MFGKIASGIAGAASKAGALGDQFKGATDKAGAMGKNIQGVVGQADAMGKNIQGVVGQNPANSNSLFSSLSKSAGNFTQTAKSLGELSQINPLEIIALFSNADGDPVAKANKIELAANLLSLKTNTNEETIKHKLNEITKNTEFIKIMSKINQTQGLPNKIKERMEDQHFVSTWMSSLSANLNSGSTNDFIALLGNAVSEIEKGPEPSTQASTNGSMQNDSANTNGQEMPVAYAVNEEKEEEKMRETFQDLIDDALANPTSPLYQKILKINADENNIFFEKLLNALPDALHISEGHKVRFIADFKEKLVVNGGKKTRRKRKRRKGKGKGKGTKRKNVTKRRK